MEGGVEKTSLFVESHLRFCIAKQWRVLARTLKQRTR
jgi:hypothetical protein